jgi:Zn-dependent protease/CBS domain-containing protein
MDNSGSLTLFHVHGIPVRAHWTLFLAIPYIAFVFSRQFAMVARMAGVEPDQPSIPPLFWGALVAVGLFASVALHELAHSLVALRAGGRVRDITLMLLGGVSRIERMPRRPSLEALMAAVGPATSLALGGLLYLAHGATAHAASDPRMGLFYLAHINLVLGLFNLLPAFPMDGGRVLRAALSGRLGPARATAIAARVGQVGAVLLGLVGFWSGNWLLLLIALFVYSGAGAEAGQEQAREALEGLRVADLMVHASPTVPLEAPVAELPAMMRAAGRIEIVVVDDAGAPAGVLSARDLADTAPEARRAMRVRDLAGLAATHAVYVSENDSALEALDRVEQGGAEYALVVTHETAPPATVGLVGPAEIQRALMLRSLERGGPRGTTLPHQYQA